MDEHSQRGRLERQLDGLDWSRGVSKAALVAQLAADPPLQAVIAGFLADGVYFSPRDVVSALPARAWRGGPDLAGKEVDVGTAARRTVGQVAQTMTETAAKAVEQTRAGASAAAQAAAGITDLPERVRQSASQVRDQVLELRTRSGDAPAPSPASTEAAPAAAPGAPAAVVGEFGQPPDRQPTRAIVFALFGLTLGVAGGLASWLGQRRRGDRLARPRPERLPTFLFGFGAATFVVNLWDVWRSTRAGAPARAPAQPGGTPPRSWADLGPAANPVRSATSTAATDELPTVGDA